jgi:hypothetical protein
VVSRWVFLWHIGVLKKSKLFNLLARMNLDSAFLKPQAWLSSPMSLAVPLMFALVSLGLVGCSAIQKENVSDASIPGRSQKVWQPEDQLKWETVKLPGKQDTQYAIIQHNEHSSLQAQAQSSASMLRKTMHVPADQLKALAFTWQVPHLIANADMAQRDFDDSPVRLVLAFEGDRNQFSAKNAMLNELTQVITGQPMPYATLMYVWCNKRPVGSVIENPRTDRIRKIVVESGSGRLNQWLSYERNIRADFEKAFGEAPGALIGIGLMTDTDNTRSKALAWYGPIELK